MTQRRVPGYVWPGMQWGRHVSKPETLVEVLRAR